MASTPKVPSKASTFGRPIAPMLPETSMALAPTLPGMARTGMMPKRAAGLRMPKAGGKMKGK